MTTTATKEQKQLWQLLCAQGHHAAICQVVRSTTFSAICKRTVSFISEHTINTTSNYSFERR
jgi:uncharacterized protein YtpQ (UPF0354 family)